MSDAPVSEPIDLEGKMLIAMPGMGDPRFNKSVIYMCAHTPEGALGLIVNKPTPELSFGKLLKQLNLDIDEPMRDIRVHFGGPVENGRGFVLHSAEYDSPASTLKVSNDFAMTATLDILEDMANGGGPKDAILTLGYAGWGPGQLESEILQNGWLTCEAERDIVFDEAIDDKWTAALGVLGIDPLMLSAHAGRA